MKVIPHGREFAGFSLEQIEEVTRGREEKRKEQGRALRMEKKLQANIFFLSRLNKVLLCWCCDHVRREQSGGRRREE